MEWSPVTCLRMASSRTKVRLKRQSGCWEIAKSRGVQPRPADALELGLCWREIRYQQHGLFEKCDRRGRDDRRKIRDPNPAIDSARSTNSAETALSPAGGLAG